MQEVAEQSPEMAKAIEQYNQVKGWVDQGAKITEDLKLDKNGGLAGGSIEIGETPQDLSKLIDPESKEGSLKVKNMGVSAQQEGGDITLTAKEGGSAEIDGKKYEHLKANSKIITDRTRKIKEADMTFNEPTTIEIGDKTLKVEKDMRVVYKNGNLEVYGKDQTVQVDQNKITINGENNIKLEGQKITGKDFTIDEKRFTGVEDKLAEMKIVDEGYLLGKDTMMTDNRMIITSEEGNVLYSKVCGDVSGFSSYVSPCRTTLSIEGDGFSVQMKEGKQFGLNIEKGDILKYDFDGAKVVINNGEQSVSTAFGKSVTMTNGGIIQRYVMIDGEPQELIDPESLGGNYDVAMSTKLAPGYSDDNTLITTENEKTTYPKAEDIKENVYVCPLGSEISGAAITGAASLLERCKEAASSLFSNSKVKPGSVQVGQDWGGEKITGIYDRTSDSLVVHTKDASGNIQIYRLKNDGTIEKKVVGEWVVDKEYVLTEDEKTWFGLKTTSAQGVPSSKQEITNVDNAAKGVTEKLGGETYTVNIKEGGYSEVIIKQGKLYRKVYVEKVSGPGGETFFESIDSGEKFKLVPGTKNQVVPVK